MVANALGSLESLEGSLRRTAAALIDFTYGMLAILPGLPRISAGVTPPRISYLRQRGWVYEDLAKNIFGALVIWRWGEAQCVAELQDNLIGKYTPGLACE